MEKRKLGLYDREMQHVLTQLYRANDGQRKKLLDHLQHLEPKGY